MNARVAVAFVALALAGPALAQASDPPGRVARLSLLQGDVSLQPGDGESYDRAVLNRPVTSGDRLVTGRDARAEITLGIAAVRLDEQTDLSVAVLEDDILQIEVHAGTVAVHLRQLSDADTVQIDTPGASVQLLAPGDYRIDVTPEGHAALAVRGGGEAQIDDGRDAARIGDGQEAHLAGDLRSLDVRPLRRRDAFDDWSDDRERQLTAQETIRYVPREVVGYEDLDRYGRWHAEPEYGMVWVPRVVVGGWAPYRFGHWAWVSPWGWTWIDASPWGFAPFHYGRWAYVRDRWCWVPGPRHRRPVYAPALVGFVGGPHLDVSISFGSGPPLRWVPLAPREVYVPWHRATPHYVRNVNVANTLIVDNVHITNAWRERGRGREWRYRNADVPGAIGTGGREPPRHAFAGGAERQRPRDSFDGRDDRRPPRDAFDRRSAPRPPGERRAAQAERPEPEWRAREPRMARSAQDGRAQRRALEQPPRSEQRRAVEQREGTERRPALQERSGDSPRAARGSGPGREAQAAMARGARGGGVAERREARAESRGLGRAAGQGRRHDER